MRDEKFVDCKCIRGFILRLKGNWKDIVIIIWDNVEGWGGDGLGG